MPMSLDCSRLHCSNGKYVSKCTSPLTSLQGDSTHLELSIGLSSLSAIAFDLAANMISTFPSTSVLYVQNALTLNVLSLIGCQICHTCSLGSRARPFGLIKSLVLDSMILRERHKISMRRLYWLCHLVFHSNCSTAKLKTLIKTKQLDSNLWLVEYSNVINCKI